MFSAEKEGDQADSCTTFVQHLTELLEQMVFRLQLNINNYYFFFFLLSKMPNFIHFGFRGTLHSSVFLEWRIQAFFFFFLKSAINCIKTRTNITPKQSLKHLIPPLWCVTIGTWIYPNTLRLAAFCPSLAAVPFLFSFLRCLFWSTL